MIRSPLFVFDMDDVLFDYDWRVRIMMRQVSPTRKGRAAHPGTLERVMPIFDTAVPAERAAEAGRFTNAEEYHAAFTRAMDRDIPVGDWIANRRSGMTPWPDSLAAVARAAQLGTVSLLTNNGPLVEAYLAELAPELVPLFGKELHTSSFYGARKPDPIVFANMLAFYGVPAEQVFFTDDLEVNVEGARSVGIESHRFTNPGALLQAIERFAERVGASV
jgi:FMN phosphatase YigB (HAD superfamily)